MPACLPSARLNALTLAGNIPVSVTIELTRRCPLACRHCYLPETRGRTSPGPELSTARWKAALRQLARAGGLYLVFTGGEPLLRPDLAELCRAAKKLNFDVRVFSTGLGLTPALAAEFNAAGVSAFELSFYGGPAVHDGVTGQKGSFKRTLAAGRLLKAANLKVRMKVPLMDLNAAQAGVLNRLAAAEAFDISFDPVIAPANDGDKGALKHRLSGRALALAVKQLQAPPGSSTAGAPAMDFLCGAGRNVCAVGPGGELYPCLQLPVKLGNLTRSAFSRIWAKAPWLKRWRSYGLRDLPVCRACALLSYCSRCPGISLLEEGDFLAPNKAACEMAGLLGGKPV